MENKNTDQAQPDRPRYQFGQGASQSVPRAALRFDAGDLEIGDNGEGAKTAPVKMLARSGQPIEHWYWGRVVHDLAGMQAAKPRIPIDYCHDPAEVIGYANKFDTTTGDLVLSGALVPYTPDDDDKATEVLYKAKAGVPYEASINFGGDGIQVQEVGPGETTPVNGYMFQGPGLVVRQWPLRGVAICPYGADGNTSAEFKQDQSAEHVTVKLFKQELKEMPEKTTPAEAATTPPAVEAEKQTPAATPATEAAPATTPAAAVELAQGGVAPQPGATGTAEAAPQAAPAVEAGNKGNPGASAAEFGAAFGDVGFRWHHEGKTFAACATDFVAELRKQHGEAVTALKAAHKTEADALNATVEDLKAKLAAAPRGNEPAGFGAEGKTGPEAEQAKRLEQNMGANLAKFAGSIKFAEKPAAPRL